MSQTHDSTLSVADIIQQLDNPYALYQQLRETDPVYWDERANSWVLTRYADVAAALRDPRYTVMGFMSDTSWIPDDMRPTMEPRCVRCRARCFSRIHLTTHACEGWWRRPLPRA